MRNIAFCLAKNCNKKAASKSVSCNLLTFYNAVFGRSNLRDMSHAALK